MMSQAYAQGIINPATEIPAKKNETIEFTKECMDLDVIKSN